VKRRETGGKSFVLFLKGDLIKQHNRSYFIQMLFVPRDPARRHRLFEAWQGHPKEGKTPKISRKGRKNHNVIYLV